MSCLNDEFEKIFQIYIKNYVSCQPHIYGIWTFLMPPIGMSNSMIYSLESVMFKM